MTDQLQEFMLAQFQGIRAEIATLAASSVGVRRDLEGVREEIKGVREELARHSARIDSLAHAVGSMRHDMKVLAIAFDGHGARLDRIEKHVGFEDSTH